MIEELATYWSGLKISLKQPALAGVLMRALKRHRRIEAEFRRLLMETLPGRERFRFPHLDLAAEAYFQRNFFSILFLSLFETLGIAEGRQEKYGLILHAVRGIVTSADNIVDREDKGAVKLIGCSGRTIPNIMLILLQDGLLHQAIHDLSDNVALRNAARTALMEALTAIAREEGAEEEGADITLLPDEVLGEIHSFRGGKLLQLAFVVPKVFEVESSDGIEAAMEGIHHIGMALQILDDVTDLAEDIANRNHNILRSWIVHLGPDGYLDNAALMKCSADELTFPERLFPQATREVIGRSMATAMEGFEILRRMGYPVDNETALGLIEMLFTLRGLKRLWDFWYSTERGVPDCAATSAG